MKNVVANDSAARTPKSIVVVGAGAWGQNLIRTFHQLGVLAAVVDTDPKKLEQVQTNFRDVATFPTLEAARSLQVSAAAIATPASTHFERTKEALEMGLDVFVEKPFTLSLETARELTRLAEARGRVLMVGHLLLYQPAVRWMAAFLKSGELGKIFSIHQERLNLGKVRSVEDVLWSFGVHDIAVLLNLVGEKPSRIQTHWQAALQPEVADDFFLHCSFPSGIRSHLHVSWLWPEKSRRTVIVAEKGMLIYNEASQTVAHHKKHVSLPSLVHSDLGAEIAFEQVGEPLKLELQHFLDRCQDRQPALSCATSACDVIEVLESASRR